MLLADASRQKRNDLIPVCVLQTTHFDACLFKTQNSTMLIPKSAMAGSQNVVPVTELGLSALMVGRRSKKGVFQDREYSAIAHESDCASSSMKLILFPGMPQLYINTFRISRQQSAPERLT